MAFLQLRFVNDPDAEDFINIGNSVGLGKTNAPDDVLVVQALLAINFDNNPRLKKRRPGNRPVVVSKKLERDTPALIATFQSVMLNRPQPQGFCSQAPATASNQIDFNTLFRLWGNATLIQAALAAEEVLTKLQREHPSLQNLPRRASEMTIGH